MKLVDKYSWIDRFRQGVGSVVLGTALLLSSTVVEAGSDLSVDIEGCSATALTTYEKKEFEIKDRNISLYVCDPGGYVDGNLKAWAELDMVPHQYTVHNKSNGPVDFNFTVGGDYIDSNDATLRGWDYITELALDPSSDQACFDIEDVSSQALIITPDQTIIYRQVVVKGLPAGATCIANYNMRLALGASGYTGSSLQDFLVGEGGKTLPISAVTTTGFSKTMSATQGGTTAWTVSKSSEDGEITFNDTCDESLPLQKDINITVSWVKHPPTPAGNVNVVTHISAQNLSRRDLDINVTDTLYSGTTPLATHICPQYLLEAGHSEVICTNTFTISEANATDLNDIAVAYFIDPDFVDENNTMLGERNATANALVQGSGENTDENATIKDHEWIVGNHLSYSVASPDIGTFDNYTAGTVTTGDVNWTSNLQTGSDSVTFTKTVYAVAGTSTSGSLKDRATLKGSGGFGTNSGTFSIDLSSHASVALTITKTMDPTDIPDSETLDFNFTVRSPSPLNFNETFTIEVNETNPSNSLTISGLDPSWYSVQENAKFGYEAEGNSTREVNLNLPNCKASVTFTNIIADRPAVKVRKVTFPAGNEHDWEMTLYEQNLSVPGGWTILTTATTTDAGWIEILGQDHLQAGTYKIEETMQGDWYEANRTMDCSFTYHPDVDGNRSDYECVFANAKYAEIIINKEIVEGSASGTFGFTQNIDTSGPFELRDGESRLYSNLMPGTYSVIEYDPSPDDESPDYDLSGLGCTETEGIENTVTSLLDHEAIIQLEAGERVECTFTNQERGRVNVVKLEDGDATTEVWTFTLEGPEGIMERNTTNGGLNFEDARLAPGTTYTLCEIKTHVAWDANWTLNGTSVVPETVLHEDHLDRCYDFNVSVGKTAEFEINNISPNPGINIEKFTNGEDADDPTGPFITTGSPVTWRYYVTNFGDTNLTNVIVTDSNLTVTVDCDDQTTLAAGDTMICTASGSAIAGQYANIGTVTAESVSDPVQDLNDSDPSHYFGEASGITIEKSTNGEDADAAPGPYIPVGATVNWTYDINNTGNVELINITVTDDQGVTVTCPQTTLAVGVTMTCTASGTATAGQYTNIGTAAGMTPSGASINANDPSNYFGETSGVAIEKLTNGEDADTATGPVVLPGSAVTWTYVVRNTGNVELTGINVTDDKEAVTCPSTTLAVGASMTCTATGTAIEGQYQNIGTVTTSSGETASDPSHYFGDPDCPCNDVKSDSSSALNTVSAALMILMTLMLGLFFVRREEQLNRNER